MSSITIGIVYSRSNKNPLHLKRIIISMLVRIIKFIAKVIASLFLALILSMLLVIIVSLGYGAIKDPHLFIGEKSEKQT
jgi:ABC-type multidrug transport system permease subunit